jgi:uncharacterized Tic20 family protein
MEEIPEAGDDVPDDEMEEAGGADDEGRPKKKKKKDRRPLREDDKTWGMFAHLGGTLFGWVGALIVFLMKKDESAFLRHHGKESLNFQLTLIPIYLILPFGFCCVSCMGSLMDSAMGGYGFIGLLVYGLMMLALMALAALNLALTIMQGMKAKKGEWSKYPFAIRLIK